MISTPLPRATRALVHLNALRKNLGIIRAALPAKTRICAPVKADAYGHGAVPVAAVLRREGIDYLAVATAFEGSELRKNGDTGDILLLGPALPAELPEAINAGLDVMVGNQEYLEEILHERRKTGITCSTAIHLKVDTGMGRFGCLPDQAVKLAQYITKTEGLTLKGLATHFPVADSPEPEDLQYTTNQAGIIQQLAAKIRAFSHEPLIVHAANSGALALNPQLAFDMVRPGLALYGYGPAIPGTLWTPIMELKTRISTLRKLPAGSTVSYGHTWTTHEDTWVATLPVGYADGYPRLLSNKASVLINGCLYPVIGNICMDQCMVNLGRDTDVTLYNDVTIFGPDPAALNAGDLAEMAQTIPYEITCGISARVPRYYIE